MPVALVLALAAVSALPACVEGGGEAVDGPVTVYVSLPLTGPQAGFGRDAADGARLALEQAGGVAGDLEVSAEFLDDARGRAWDPVAVGANARQASQDSSAAAYIGELDSQPTRTSLPITNEAGLLQVSPGAGASDLTAPASGYPDSPDVYRPSGEATFARVIPGDAEVAAAAATIAIDRGLRTVEVSAGATPSDRLLAEEFEAAASGVGVEVVRPREGGDAILNPQEGGGIVLGPPAPATEAPAPGEATFITAPLAPESLPDGDFVAAFRQEFDREPGPSAAYGYEAMALALQGIEAASQDDEEFRAGVVDAVLGASLRDSVLGSYSITEEGDTTLCEVQPYAVGGASEVPEKPVCPRG